MWDFYSNFNFNSKPESCEDFTLNFNFNPKSESRENINFNFNSEPESCEDFNFNFDSKPESCEDGLKCGTNAATISKIPENRMFLMIISWSVESWWTKSLVYSEQYSDMLSHGRDIDDLDPFWSPVVDFSFVSVLLMDIVSGSFAFDWIVVTDFGNPGIYC